MEQAKTSYLKSFYLNLKIISIILMYCVCSLQAQYINFSFHQLSEKDGLLQSNKYFISSDYKGFVWIGSENGLQRFDGKKLTKFQHNPSNKYSLPENRISSKCFEDGDENLWFTSFGSLNYYLRKSNKFLHFSLKDELKDYYLFHKEKNTLWLRIGSGDQGHVYKFNTLTKEFSKVVSLSGDKCTVVKNNDGKVDMILSISLPNQSGLELINIDTGKRIKANFLETPEGSKSNFPTPTRAAFVSQKGTAWIGLYNSLGKYVIGDTLGMIHNLRTKHIIQDMGWINDIEELDSNYLLIGADKGLFLFDKKTQKFTEHYKNINGDSYSFGLKGINSVHKDSSGTIWLSGLNQKIAFTNIFKNRFPQLKETFGLSFVNISEDHNGNIWCSSLDSGTYVFSPKRELLIHTRRLSSPDFSNEVLPLPEIYFYLKNKKDEWWGNIGNYFFLWDETSKQFNLDFPYFLGVANTEFDRINFCTTLADGTNLVARGNQILEIRLDKSRVDTLPWFSLESFDINIIQHIYQDNSGRIFINDNYGKLLIFQVKNNYLTLIESKSEFGIINAFQQDKSRNKIWVGSTKGLGSFDSNTLDFEFYSDNSDGLNDKVLYDIILDSLGQLWLPSSKGIFQLNPDNQEIHQFNTADGLSSSVYSKNSSLISSRTGEIWVGGKNGINVFDPSEIKLLSNKPTPRITNILVNDESYTTNENISEIANLKFPYGQNTLSFQFAPLDYADPSSNEYLHQMVGLDEAPVPNSNRGFTRYGNLPAGNYTFKLWATNSDLVLNEEPLEISISISPPFYQTWWFYLACLCLISGIIYGFFKYRIAQILKVERLRTRIASDLHDDVGGILSGLAMQSEILELTAKEEEKEKLRQIADMSRSAMSGMRDTVWAIDSRKDKFEDLIDRMREHAEEVLTPKDFRFDINENQISMTLDLPPLIRQNIYLIYKEAITNIAKHSNGDFVDIDIEMDKSNFEMHIHDNGKFENKSYKTTGLGLSNMKMRAKNLDGELRINTDAGYEITLKIPSFA